jgi:hypothetical protein
MTKGKQQTLLDEEPEVDEVVAKPPVDEAKATRRLLFSFLAMILVG